MKECGGHIDGIKTKQKKKTGPCACQTGEIQTRDMVLKHKPYQDPGPILLRHSLLPCLFLIFIKYVTFEEYLWNKVLQRVFK